MSVAWCQVQVSASG